MAKVPQVCYHSESVVLQTLSRHQERSFIPNQACDIPLEALIETFPKAYNKLYFELI